MECEQLLKMPEYFVEKLKLLRDEFDLDLSEVLGMEERGTKKPAEDEDLVQSFGMSKRRAAPTKARDAPRAEPVARTGGDA